MAQEIVHIDKNRTLRTLTPRLRSFLEIEETTMTVSDAVLGLASDGDLRTEAEAALPMLKEAAAPAGAQSMVDVMFPYQEPFNRTPRDRNQWKMFWSVYVEALEGVSVGALKAALAAFVKLPNSQFFPAPGPLLALCEREQMLIDRRWRLIQAALSLQPGTGDEDEAVSAYSATYRSTGGDHVHQ